MLPLSLYLSVYQTWGPHTHRFMARHTSPFCATSPLTPSMWVGVTTIAFAVGLVGLSPLLAEDGEGASGAAAPTDAGGALFGIALTIAGTFMQSLQYAH